MFAPEQLREQLDTYAHGEARLEALQNAVAAADAAGDTRWGLTFSIDSAMEAVLFGAIEPAIAALTAACARLDAASGELRAAQTQPLLRCYPPLLTRLCDDPTVSAAQAEALFEAFRTRCTAADCSLRTYYRRLTQFRLPGDAAQARESYAQMLACDADNLCACAACEAAAELQLALACGDTARADALAKSVPDGEGCCGEELSTVYCALLLHALLHDDVRHAIHYARLLRPLLPENSEALYPSSVLLWYASANDQTRGTALLHAMLRPYLACENARAQLFFCHAASAMLAALPENLRLHLLVPESAPFYDKTGLYDTAVLGAWFAAERDRLAVLFDARSGSDGYAALFASAIASGADREKILLPESGTAERQPSFLAIVPREKGIITMDSMREVIDRLRKIPDVTLRSVAYDDLRGCPYITVEYDGNLYHFHLMLQPIQQVDTLRQLHNMTEQQLARLGEADEMLMTAMEFGADAQRSFQLQLKVLCAMVPDAVALLDYSRLSLISPDWATLAADAPVPPAAVYLFSMQIDRNADGTSFWLFTMGLSCLGLRELELLDIPEALLDTAFGLLVQAAAFAVEIGSLPDAGEMMHLGRFADGKALVATWLPPEEALSRYAPDVFGGVQARKEINPPSGLLLFYESQADYEARKTVLLTAFSAETLAGFLPLESNRGVFLNAQLAKVRYAFLCRGFAMCDRALVRVELELDEAQRQESGYHFELLWLTPTKITERGITGTLLESSDLVAAYSEGRELTVLPAQVSDFQLRIGNEIITPDKVYQLPYLND